MGYSRRTLNYLERITLCMVDPMTIGIETPKIDSGCSLEKEFTELICMNPLMVLCQIVHKVDSCHNCVRGPLT